MKPISFEFAGLVLFVAIFNSCSSAAAPRGAAAPPVSNVASASAMPEGVTDAMVQEGQEIYGGVGICAVCHGPDATGAIGPNLTDTEWLLGDGEFEQIVDRILSGVTRAEATNPLGATMPPKGGAPITDAQVRSVAAYVWTLSH
jgi:mono/diheme cytochrome c family protein